MLVVFFLFVFFNTPFVALGVFEEARYLDR
jgi:hypothetical protein